jgi:hypothetical protein
MADKKTGTRYDPDAPDEIGRECKRGRENRLL